MLLYSIIWVLMNNFHNTNYCKMRAKLLIFILLSVLLIGCGEKKQSKKKTSIQPIPVEVSVIDFKDGSNFRNYVGTIKSTMELTQSFSFGGTLTGVYVHNGQNVKKGDLIAQIDDRAAKSLHDAALATLKQAEDGYNRLKQVHEEGGISDVRWVQMETDLEKARSSENTTRKHLEDCSLYAPKDGVISMTDLTVGEVLHPSQKVCDILDMNSLEVEFSVPDKEISMIEIGDKAIVTIPSLNDAEKEVVIRDKAVVSNPFGHTYTVKAKLNDIKDVLPGMVAKIRMEATAKSGIVVPSSCVQTVSDGIAVWVVKDGKSYRRKITVSDYVHNGVLVSGGLDCGDVIVVKGYQKLYNGASVSY